MLGARGQISQMRTRFRSSGEYITQLSFSRALIVFIKVFIESIIGLPRSKTSLSGSTMMRFQIVSTFTVWLESMSWWTSLKTNRFYFWLASTRLAEAWKSWATCSS